MRLRLSFGAIAAVALALRILWIGHLAKTPEFTLPMLDAGFHHAWAAAWADGDWSSPRFGQQIAGITEQPYFRPPGCAAFLAAHYRLFGIRPLPPRISQALLGLLGLWFLFLLGNRLSRHGGTITALLVTFAWPILHFSGEFLDPPLLFPLVPAILLALANWRETHRLRYLAGAGLAIGVAALVRPNALIFAPVAAAWVVWQGRRNTRPCSHHEEHEAHEEKAACRSAPPSILRVLRGESPPSALSVKRSTFSVLSLFMLAAATLLPILPVTIRNFARNGEFVLISSNAGINLFIGNNPQATGVFASSLGDLGDYHRTDDIADVRDRLAAAAHKTTLTEHETSRLLGARARAFIRGNPAAWIKLLLHKTLLFWGPVEVDLNNAPEAIRASTWLRFLPVSFPVLLALALASCMTSALGVQRSAFSVLLPLRALRGESPPSALRVERSVLSVPPATRTSALPNSRTPELPNSRTPELPHSRTLALLILAFILAWFLSILPFFVSGQYRQPILPLLALLAAPFVDRLLAAFSVKRSAFSVLLLLRALRGESPPSALSVERSAFSVERSAFSVLLLLRALRGAIPSALLVIAALLLTHLNPMGYASNRALPRYNAACSMKLQGNLADARVRYRDLAELPEKMWDSATPMRLNELAFCSKAAYNLGNLEFNDGNPFRAERAFRQAIAHDPKYWNAYANLGTALFAQGRHAEAEEVLLAGLAGDPGLTYARLTLVQSLLAQGRRDAAAPHLRILAADPAAAAGLKQLQSHTLQR